MSISLFSKVLSLFSFLFTVISSFKLYNKKYKVIAINYNEWEEIKNEFNECIKKGIKKFVLKEDILLNINENDNIKFKNNDIDNMFKEIVKYE